MSPDNAYVQADLVYVATDVPGIVRAADVRENQRVDAGTVLFRLDDLPMRQAEAQLGIVHNDLAALQVSCRDMQAQICEAEADVTFFRAQFERQQKLTADEFAPRAAFDEAGHRLDRAERRLASLHQQLAGIAANLNSTPDVPVERHPRYQGAVAARDEAARKLDHAVGPGTHGRHRHRRAVAAGRPVSCRQPPLPSGAERGWRLDVPRHPDRQLRCCGSNRTARQCLSGTAETVGGRKNLRLAQPVPAAVPGP